MPDSRVFMKLLVLTQVRYDQDALLVEKENHSHCRTTTVTTAGRRND